MHVRSFSCQMKFGCLINVYIHPSIVYIHVNRLWLNGLSICMLSKRFGVLFLLSTDINWRFFRLRASSLHLFERNKHGLSTFFKKKALTQTLPYVGYYEYPLSLPLYVRLLNRFY